MYESLLLQENVQKVNFFAERQFLITEGTIM